MNYKYGHILYIVHSSYRDEQSVKCKKHLKDVEYNSSAYSQQLNNYVYGKKSLL